MRILGALCIALIVACTVPPAQSLTQKTAIPAEEPATVLPSIEVQALRENPIVHVGDSKSAKGRAKVSPYPCAGINTGDPAQDVREKLDCLARQK